MGEAFCSEARTLNELPFEDFDPSERTRARVDAKALVTIRQNRYSVPVALVGLRVEAQIGAREIVVWHERQPVARHPRLYGRFQTSARLDHYLELLRIKPGALKGSRPLRQEREHGRWPACFDELWASIEALAEGSWIADRESVILIGDSGTGKTHLAIALAICACQQGRRVRFTTLPQLANELQEAESRRELTRVVARYARIELAVLDESSATSPCPRGRPSSSSR